MMQDSTLLTPQRRALHWAALLAQSSPPTADEQGQLARFARGQAAADPVQHVLYCSQATGPFDERRLTELLEQARANNARHGITGLLCYEAGHFVQLIEGPPAVVAALFARLERDPRHQHVRVLSTGWGPLRQFTDWRLAVAGTHPAEFYWLTTYLEAHRHRLVLPQIPIPEPELVAQLETISHACTGPASNAPELDVLLVPDSSPADSLPAD